MNSCLNQLFQVSSFRVFGKTMENVRQHRDIKLLTTERRKTYLALEPSYHSTKFFKENLSTTEMRKTQTLMNKPVSFGLLILDLSKTVMHEFWYNYVKSKLGKNTKLYMDTDSFIVHVKANDIYKDIAEDLTLQILK